MKEQKDELQAITHSERKRTKLLFFVPWLILFGFLYYFGIIGDYPPGTNIFTLVFGLMVIVLIYEIAFLEKYFFTARHVKSSQTLFETFGYERLVLRFNYILQNRNSGIRLAIYNSIVFGLFLVLTTFMIYEDNSLDTKIKYQITTIGFILIPWIIVYSLHTIKTSISWKYDFNYYYSKTCFSMIINHDSIPYVTKTKWLIAGLNYYNNYLRSELGKKINHLDKFAIVLLGNSDAEMKLNVQRIYENYNDDTMSVLRYIRDKHPEFQLSKEFLPLQVKELLPVILGPIPIILGIIKFFI